MSLGDYQRQIRTRLQEELGTILKDAPEKIALLYPSPYHVGMSSLGFQTLYRGINAVPGRAAERAFLPDDLEAHGSLPILSYESGRSVADFPVLGLSVAYELELAGVVQALTLAGIPPLAEERREEHPFVLCGGPLTFSNPLPLAPFADAILMGEADETIHLANPAVSGGCRPWLSSRRASFPRSTAISCRLEPSAATSSCPPMP